MTSFKFALLLLSCTNVLGFAPSLPRSRTSSLIICHDYADGAPSDYDTEDLESDVKEVTVDENVDDVLIRDALKRELLLLASVTNRGEYASHDERDIAIDLVTQLEALNPTAEPASHCEGDWDLCLSSTQFFRSSPFFQAIRCAVGDDNKQIAENGFDLHERATSNSRVGRVRQTITSDQLISEVDLEVGIAPGIPIKVKGTVVTSASLKVVSDKKWDLKVENTKVRGSNIPIFNEIMENDLHVELPVGDFYNTVQGGVPVIPMSTFYVDESMRITRDIDDNFFVFSRA